MGKTTFAQQLAECALRHRSGHIKDVVIVNEESVCVNQTKAQCYESSLAEKSTRSSLKAKVDQALSSSNKSTLVICDSLNYIKGYRYELHCLSKATQQKHGVVWLLNATHVAKQWNRQRNKESLVVSASGGGSVTATTAGDHGSTGTKETKGQDDGTAASYFYSEKQMEQLIQRYEPPDSRNRWDQPLWRIDLTPSDEANRGDGANNVDNNQEGTATARAARDALSKSVYNMHSLSDAINTDAAVTMPTKVRGGKKSKSAASSFKKKNNKKKQQSNSEASGESVASPGDSVTTDNSATTSPTVGSTNASSTAQPVATLKASPSATTATTTTNKNKSVETQIEELLDSFLLDVAPLKQGLSTRLQVTADADTLHAMDGLTLRVCNAIVSTPTMGGTILLKEYGGIRLKCNRNLPLTELKRLRKEYLRWVARAPPTTEKTTNALVQSFVSYIETQL